MREAVADGTEASSLYEIAEIRETA
jgi:hypothetical protein